MRWKFHNALDGLSQDETESLSLDDTKKSEKLSIEQNAWTVAKNVGERINHEPGAAGDYMQSFVTPHKNAQFFFLIQNNYASLCQRQNPSKKTSQELHILRN